MAVKSYRYFLKDSIHQQNGIAARYHDCVFIVRTKAPIRGAYRPAVREPYASAALTLNTAAGIGGAFQPSPNVLCAFEDARDQHLWQVLQLIVAGLKNEVIQIHR